MPWFRLDDSFHSHPKVIAAGNEAIGLFVRSGTYAAEHLTDGFIGEDIAALYGARKAGPHRRARTGKPESLADTLVRTGLWHRARNGWTIHDYLDYNPSREDVERERKQAAQRQRRRRDTITSRRDSRRDTAVSHTTPTRPVKEPPNPPPSGGQRHAGQHENCRACGTNPRGPTPPPIPTPMPPPVAEVNRVNGKPARGDTVHAIAAKARAAITQEDA